VSLENHSHVVQCQEGVAPEPWSSGPGVAGPGAV